MEYRIEHDFLGERKVPKTAYYGIQTLRAVENFPIMGVPVHAELVTALACVKKAAARANMDVHLLNRKIGEAIVQAADEVQAGAFRDQFIVDAIQGGAGTSINMNMNEVLANRALELLGKEKGDYFHCHPNNHVNMSQSTNDTIPTSIKMAAYRLALQLLEQLALFADLLFQKAKEFDDVIKMGRTHLQDAVPIRMGQEFSAYGRVVQRDIGRISLAVRHLLTVNMGATAVGTSLNAKPAYIEQAAEYLREQSGFDIRIADDLVDATQNTDAYTECSAALKVCAVNLSKICNDIRLMASGPKAGLNELLLPPRQPGSSIMPGKINPVMAEVLNQVAFQVMGNDHTLCMACEAGQLELNVMGPVIAHNLLQSILILKNGIHVFHKYALQDLAANRLRCQCYVDESFGIMTALNPHLGYETAAQVVKEAMKTGKTIREICLEHHYLTPQELDDILNPYQMTTPGIAGAQYLKDQ